MVDLTEYYGLVFHLARQMHQRLRHVGVAIELDDLVQEGMVGLIQAAQCYDPRAGIRFTTFAYPRIAGAIKDALRREDPLSQEERQQVRELKAVRGRLVQVGGKEPLEGELAEWLEISFAEFHRLKSFSQISEMRAGLAVGPELAVEPNQESDLTWRQLGEEMQVGLAEVLDPTERQVLVLRFWAGLALKKVGIAMGKSLQTVHKIEVRARRKMKEWLEARGWEVTDIF